MREAVLISVVLTLSVAPATVSRAQTPEQCFTIAGIEWAASTGVAALPATPLPAAFAASYAAYAANLILKECEPKLDPPADVASLPDTAGGCAREFEQPVLEGNYESSVDEASILLAGVNALDGFEIGDLSRETLTAQPRDPIPFNLPAPLELLLSALGDDSYPYVRPGHPLLGGLNLSRGFPVWGELGVARVAHFNTTVELRLVVPAEATRQGSKLILPLGEHFLRWEADTLRSPLDLYNVPIPVIEAKKSDKKLRRVISGALEGITAAKSIVIRGIEYGQNAGAKPIKDIFDPKPRGIANSTTQRVRVFDDVLPTISAPGGVAAFEALDIGGSRLSRNIEQLRAAVTISDACRTPEDLELQLDTSSFVAVDDDFLLPLGEHTLVWTVLDPGPNSSSGSQDPLVRNAASTSQTIRIEDTFAPSLLPPPSQLIVGPSAIPVANIDLGSPQLFDLADPLLSTVAATLPASGFFAANERTQLRWTATDSSLNQSEAFQWITVKTQNSVPAADAIATITTKSSLETQITISGSDSDPAIPVRTADGTLLPAIPDPLVFRIEDQPAHGVIKAPLLPYFVDDYRILTADECFNGSGQYIGRITCANAIVDATCPQPPPRSFIWEPEYVSVTDAGTTYVLDSAVDCRNTSGDVEFPHRISKWNALGEYQSEHVLGTQEDDTASFALDRDGNLHFFRPESSAQQNNAVLTQLDPDLVQIDSRVLELDRLGLSPRLIAAIPSGDDLIYGATVNELIAFDARTPGAAAVELSRLVSYPTQPTEVSFTLDLATDSAGNVLVSLPGSHKIYKVSPSSFDADGNFVPGQLIGWLGKCDTRIDPTTPANQGCDIVANHSNGFSCSDAICGNSGLESGAEPGQFALPLGIAVDPNDNLYVTDFDNIRIQRFTPTGLYAGQASANSSAPDDQIEFVVDEFFAPIDISVNSTHLYSLNQDEDLLLSFEATPFEQTTPSSATLSYQSDPGYVGPDMFTFRVSDGFRLPDGTLAESVVAGVVPIDVQRGQHPPIPEAGIHALAVEDVALDIPVSAFDPDGTLDTLTFAVVQQPQFGTALVPGGIDTSTGLPFALVSYVPNPDFEGLDELGNPVVDELVYSVSDGLFTVEETLRITVAGVKDAARLTLESFTDPAPAGFETTLIVSFSDPDFGDTHPDARIVWGDGSIDLSEDYPGSRLEFQPGTGVVSLSHVYTNTAATTVEACVREDGGSINYTPDEFTGCISLPVTPQTGFVKLDVSASQPPPGIAVGSAFDTTVSVTNVLPQTVSALQAQAVVLTAELPPGLRFLGATPQQGSCSFSAGVITCDLQTLAPGASASVDVDLRLLAPNLPGEGVDVVFAATAAQPDANGGSLALLELQAVCNPLLCPTELIAHRGANDPTNEGWTRTGGTSVIEGPTGDGLGLAAWSIDDFVTSAGSSAQYLVAVPPASIADAQALGWLLRSRLQVVQPGGDFDPPDLGVNVEYSDGTTRWRLEFGVQLDGDPVLLPEGQPEIALEGFGDDYHLYDLSFDPAAGTVSLHVDGMLVLANFAGLPAGSVTRVVFGASQDGVEGHGNYNLVSFSVLGSEPLAGLDTDGDGLTDFQELALAALGFDWTAADSEGDLDGDGFSAAEEIEAGSDQLDPRDTPFDRSMLRDGDLLVSAPASGIVDVIPTTGEQFGVSPSTNFEQPTGVAIDSYGHIYVVDNARDAVLRVNPATGASTMLSAGGALASPIQVALDLDENLLVTVEDAVVRIDSVSGDQEIVASGDLLQLPWGIVVDALGAIYVAESSAGAIVSIDPVDGSQEIVSSGDLLSEPRGLALEPSTGWLLASEATSDAIVRIDPTTGMQFPVSSGGELNGVQGITVGFDDEIAVAIDSDAIVGIDPDDGSQRLITTTQLVLSPMDVTRVPEPRGELLIAFAIATLAWQARRRRA